MEEVVGSIPTRSTSFLTCSLLEACTRARPGVAGKVVGPIPTRSTNTLVVPTVYILQSQSTQRFYIGCADNPSARLVEHQRGQTKSTRNRGPWSLVHQETFETLSQARTRERQLKSWKSHRSIQELIDVKKAAAGRDPA
jgi:putative endonuclease